MPGSAHADGRPGGGARMKGRGLGASEADACAMLKEERAATLTQFLVIITMASSTISHNASFFSTQTRVLEL